MSFAALFSFKNGTAMAVGAENDDYSFRSLVECYESARQRSESPLVAATAHVCHDLDAPLLARDPFQFALVLGVWLLYLYTRSLPAVVAVITVFYLVEFVVFSALNLSLRDTCAALKRRYSRTGARISDPIVMIFSLFAIHGALEFTLLGQSGAALAYTRQEIADNAPRWRAALIVAALLLVAIFPRRRIWAAAGVLSASLIVWLVDRSGAASPIQRDLANWILLRSILLTAFAFLSMLVPLGAHYIENSWLANAQLLFVLCSATFAFA